MASNARALRRVCSSIGIADLSEEPDEGVGRRLSSIDMPRITRLPDADRIDNGNAAPPRRDRAWARRSCGRHRVWHTPLMGERHARGLEAEPDTEPDTGPAGREAGGVSPLAVKAKPRVGVGLQTTPTRWTPTPGLQGSAVRPPWRLPALVSAAHRLRVLLSPASLPVAAVFALWAHNSPRQRPGQVPK